jgi:hypothetical protein
VTAIACAGPTGLSLAILLLLRGISTLVPEREDTSIYYKAPDGNGIETQFDKLDVETADFFMNGSYFAKNPMLLFERYRSGEPMSESIRQGSALPPKGAPPVRPDRIPDYDDRGA